MHKRTNHAETRIAKIFDPGVQNTAHHSREIIRIYALASRPVQHQDVLKMDFPLGVCTLQSSASSRPSRDLV